MKVFEIKINNTILDLQSLLNLFNEYEKKILTQEEELKKLEKEYNELQEKYSILEASMTK